ncbi:hypothetical protein C0995_000682 [Termitomyces sp. Mi166|nr:hypothetical protein C0995_000682 [Termitomyces sp. Mi166\
MPCTVGQMESYDYAKKAFQWAKALKLLDLSIKLVTCGVYTVSEGKHVVNVMGCFDEWNVWDPVCAPGEKGAEEHYDLSDALAIAAWNVFVRNANVVKIACIAQSINVILLLLPLRLVSSIRRHTTPCTSSQTLMQGSSIDVFVSTPLGSSNTFYAGPTVPKFILDLTKHTLDSRKLMRYVDVSAVLADREREVRIAMLNQHEEQGVVVPIRFGPGVQVEEEVRVYEVWSADLRDTNTFGDERVKTVERVVRFTGSWELKRHSFQVLVFKLRKEE